MKKILILAVVWMTPFLVQAGLLDNIHTVEAGKLYRSAQLDEPTLEKLVKKEGIRTIINLRGIGHGRDWYEAELNVVRRNNLDLVDIRMSADRLPHRKDLITLLDSLRDAKRPILIHCRAGVDRTGEAAAIYQMLYMGKTKTEALKMLSAKYGHFEFNKPAKRYFIRDVWQGIDWAYNDYDPCSGKYKHYDVNYPECKSQQPPDDSDGDT